MRSTRLARGVLIGALALGVASARAAPPDDPSWEPFQWGPRQVRADAAWSESTGQGVRIAIVDTGVDLGHPDLAPQLLPGATFSGCPEAPAGCGTGSWLDGPGPYSAHGTHVAGIAAAATNNGIGIAGTAPDARILPVKVLTDDGGTTSEIGAGIAWATAQGADVINLSLGGLPGAQAFVVTGAFEPMHQAIDAAVAAGVIVIAAAGNDAASACGEPAFHPDVLCVVATDRLESRAVYSNFPIDPEMNVVAAPGGRLDLASCDEDVISTVPVVEDGPCSSIHAVSGYDFFAGTSMAAPHVSGVAALLLAQGRAPENALEALRSTARTPPTNQQGLFTATHGFGIVDASAAVREPGAVVPVPFLPAAGLLLLAGLGLWRAARGSCRAAADS